MKIESNSAIKNITQNKNKYISAPKQEFNTTQNITTKNIVQYSYPNIYFCGSIYPKKINHILDTDKLLKKLNDILKLNVEESKLPREEQMLKSFGNLINFLKKKTMMRDLIMNKMEDLLKNKKLNHQQRVNEGHKLLKELNKIDKMKFCDSKNKKVNITTDSPIDFILINKFKNALLSGNLNFEKIYKKHYAELNNIKTLKELEQKFPKIYIPKRPEDIVAHKIEKTLTRDFYEDILDLIENNNLDDAKKYIQNKLYSIMDNLFENKSPEEKERIFKKLTIPTLSAVLERFKIIKKDGSFNSVFKQIKQKDILTDKDRLLLDVDYDDFVLTVLREQYLNFKKPNEIVYTKNGVNIKVNSEYKFQKLPRNILNLIKEAETIKQSQRNYDIYTDNQFKERLEFYADRFGENDEILQKIINFADCKYTQDDVVMLKSFLKELDSVWDEDKTLTEALKFINKNSIEPKGTNELNEIERNNALKLRKIEQKNFAQLKNIQENFDDKINLLYRNNLSYLAEICSDFRPTSLDKKELETANKVIELITKNYDSNTKKINISKVETDITRWNKYYEYSEIEPDSKKLELAKKYALNNDGTIDTNKAGKYLINAEALDAYPQSIDFARNKDLFKLTVENSGKNPDTIIKNLCKYDDYLDLEDSQKSFIKEILNIFDMKNDLDKNIIKYIIENEYINKDTKNWATLDEKGSKKVLAIISPKAKHELIDKYKFPQCIEFFEAFEDALTQFATTRGTSGIKHLGKNNKNMKNVYELKIMGHDDRLIAYNGYYFDEFSPTGFH